MWGTSRCGAPASHDIIGGHALLSKCEMPDEPVCASCGEEILPDEPNCPYCAGRKPYPFLHREPILIAGIIALAVVLWLVTHGVTQAYGHRQDHLARTWYATGDAAFRAGQADAAIADFRTALAYSHDSPTVRLRLAQALAANGNIRQAQAYLRALWDETPGDSTVNLELARLATHTGNVADAQRYYHGAIYGVWDDDPVARRRNARLELTHFLLSHRQYAQAESELIALSVDLPNDPALRLQVGQMFLQTGDESRALTFFRDVAQKEPRSAAAFAGAGAAAFAQQDYGLARRYLERAVTLNAEDAQSKQLLEEAALVLQMDPYVARIGREERIRRVQRAFEQAQYRLEKCAEDKGVMLTAQPPPPGPLATDYAQIISFKPNVTTRALRNDPDTIDSAMDLALRSETDAASVCGAGEAADAALLLIARAHGSRP